MTTYTLTGDLADLLPDADFTRAAARLEASNAGDVIEDGEIRFPVTPITVAADGTFTLAGIPSSVGGVNYRFVVEARRLVPGGPNVRYSYGPFLLLEDGHLGLWATVASDTFTDPNGTDLDVHIADTGQAWTMTGGTLEIQSNALDNASGHGFAPEGQLDLGGAYPDGIRSTAPYTTAAVSSVAVGGTYASTTYGAGPYAFGVRVKANGTLETQAAGLDSLSLTGTLTGHPATGTIAVECIGTALTVYINDVAVATGILPGELYGTKAWLQLENADSTADNLVVRGRFSSLGPPLQPEPPAPEPAWRAHYGDYMPLAGEFDASLTITAADSIQAAVDLIHAAVGPGGWGVVLLEPGTYTERVVGSTRVAIVGTTGDPADVIVQAAGGTAPDFSPINGTPFFLGGIHFKLTSGVGSGQYAYHITATGLQIAESCTFESQSVSRSTAIGADTTPGARFYMIDCTLIEAFGGGNFPATNLHGTVAGVGSRMAFINCSAAGHVGWNDLETANPDEFWWVGGPAYGYQEGGGGPVNTTNSTFYLDTTLVGAGVGGSGTPTIVRTTALPTMPVHGVV